MHVIDRTFFFSRTYLVLKGTAPIIDYMDKVMAHEKVQSPENAGSVHCLKYGFQIGKRHGRGSGHYCLQDQQTVWRGFYITAYEFFKYAFTHNFTSCLHHNRPYNRRNRSLDNRNPHSYSAFPHIPIPTWHGLCQDVQDGA